MSETKPYESCACNRNGDEKACAFHSNLTVEMLGLLRVMWERWRSGVPVTLSWSEQERMVHITGWQGPRQPTIPAPAQPDPRAGERERELETCLALLVDARRKYRQAKSEDKRRWGVSLKSLYAWAEKLTKDVAAYAPAPEASEAGK